MKGLLADLKHALRIYGRTPVASAIVVGVLAVGMAFVSSFVSLYVDLNLRPHPGIAQSGRIVTIGPNDGRFRLHMLDRIAEEVTSLEAAAGVATTALEIGPERDARYVSLVTRDFFRGIRPKLALGRGFDDADHFLDAAPVAVISDDYWRQQFDRNPDVLGRAVQIHQRDINSGVRTVDGRPEILQQEGEGAESTEFRIVGVMAPDMRGLWTTDIEVWVPLDRAVTLIYPPDRLEDYRRNMRVSIVGRRAPGVSTIAVANELESRYSGMTDEFFLPNGFTFDAIDGIVRYFDVHRETQQQLQRFLVGSILLALVAAANVSLFLLARAPGRRRELAIRMSVGAPIKRLARQLASESGLLVLAAAGLGLMMSVWLSNFLQGLTFLRRAEWNDVTLLDWRVLGLVGGFLILVTLAVSLAPVLGLKRLGIAASSRQVTASATLAQRIAGTAQIAIAGTLGGAGIAFTWYLGSLMLAYPGYETDDRYLAEFEQRYSIAGQTVVGTALLSFVEQERLRETLESLPSVEGVAFGGPVPGSGMGRGRRTISDPEDPTRQTEFGTGTIDHLFIEMLGLRLVSGRAPTEGESDVAVINEMAARWYFGRDDVLGENLPIPVLGTFVIVGVLEDISFWHPAAAVEPLAFLTTSPEANRGRATVIQSSLPLADLQRDIQSLIDSGALEVVSATLTPLEQIRSGWIAPDRARGYLTIATTILVALLAAFGFYGTQRYLVAAGRREYAIRASLGAGPNSLGRLVFRRGFALGLPGMVFGGPLAFIAVAWVRDDFGSRDISAGAVTFAVVAGLAALLFVASLGPARQARQTEPASLLRED